MGQFQNCVVLEPFNPNNEEWIQENSKTSALRSYTQDQVNLRKQCQTLIKKNFFNKNKPPALDNTQRSWQRTDMLTYIHSKCIHSTHAVNPKKCCLPPSSYQDSLQVLSYTTQDNLHRAAPTTVGETLSHPSLIKKIPYTLTHRLVWVIST